MVIECHACGVKVDLDIVASRDLILANASRFVEFTKPGNPVPNFLCHGCFKISQEAAIGILYGRLHRSK